MEKGDAARRVPAMPDTDPALPIVSAIVRVIAVSDWSFARIKPSGGLTSLLSTRDDGSDFETLTLEYASQRAKVKVGPRIAATLGPLGKYESGITLLFADARNDFGILMLRRTAVAGLFSSTEVGILSFALDAASERLSALRMHLEPRFDHVEFEGRTATARPISDVEAALYILDGTFEIVLAWTSDEERRAAATGLRTHHATRLPAVLEESVRALTAVWKGDPAPKRGVARPVPFLTVRALPMAGSAGSFIGVRIERVPQQNSLADAAVRYRLTPREVQVLALLFDGSHLDEISRTLHITSSTVQDHIKSAIRKTGSRNRSELIAHILGWEFEPSAAT